MNLILGRQTITPVAGVIPFQRKAKLAVCKEIGPYTELTVYQPGPCGIVFISSAVLQIKLRTVSHVFRTDKGERVATV